MPRQDLRNQLYLRVDYRQGQCCVVAETVRLQQRSVFFAETDTECFHEYITRQR
jgi:hypothetical protein